MPLPLIVGVAVRVGVAAAGKIIAKRAATAAAKKAAEAAAKKAAEEAAKKAAAQGLGRQAGTAAARDAAKKAAEESLKKSAGKGPGNTVGKHKAKKAKRGKLKCGEHGKYGDLQKKTGDNKFDRDHIPSKAALKARAEALLGKVLTPAQAKAIDKAAAAIAIPKQAHIDVSPTYGQSPAEALKDSKNLAGSAKRDVNSMLKRIGEYDEDGNCKKAYRAAAQGILKMTNKDYDKWIAQTLKGIK